MTKVDAQKVIKIISGDKAKTQTYCGIVKLGDQISRLARKRHQEKVVSLSQKIRRIGEILGPEYVALMDGLRDIDPESEDGEEISSMFTSFDKLCAE